MAPFSVSAQGQHRSLIDTKLIELFVLIIG